MPIAKTVYSGEFALQCVVEGSGVPVLIIGSPIYHRRIFSEFFRKNFKCIFMDHRGFVPHTGTVDLSEFSLDVLMNDIELVRKDIGIDKFFVIGHSGHGYLALEYAKRYPQHVLGAAMIGLAPDLSEKSQKAADEYFQQHASVARKQALLHDTKNLQKEVEADPDNRLITYLIRLKAKGWYDYTFDPTPLWEGVTVNMQMFDHVWGGIFKNIDITEGLEHFDVPTFLALGKYDFIVAPPSSWETIIPKFKDIIVHMFEKSGHTPQYEEPELFDEKFVNWVEKVLK